MIASANLRTRSMSAFVYREPDGKNVTQAKESVSDAALEALGWLGYGVLVLDGYAHVRFANAKTRELFHLRRLVVQGGRLCAPAVSDTSALRQLIAHCARIDHNWTEMRDHAACRIGDLLLQFAPLSGQPSDYIVSGRRLVVGFVLGPSSDVNPTPEQLRLRFGLTTAEAIFACEIVKGDGLMQCARKMGVSEATARTHLHRIFEKTGTKRQAQLVRMLLATRPPCPQPGPEISRVVTPA